MLGTDSVLLREWSWTSSDFQMTLQDQYDVLEEVVAKRSSFSHNACIVDFNLPSVAQILNVVV